MNEKELAEIEARAEAATPGPWDIGHEAPPLYAGNNCITAKLGERVAIIFEANHNFELDNSANFIAHARQDVPALVAEVRRLTNLLEALEFLTEDETGMLSDAPLTPDKLVEILRLLKDQRDYAAETAEMHAKEVERLNKLVCFARLYISDGNNIDGMSHIDFAEKNGIYQEYLDAVSWDQVFQDALKGGEG